VHRHDSTYFLTTDNWHIQSIRNKCLQLISSLIEVFNDEALEAILLFVQNICITTDSPSDQNQNRPTAFSVETSDAEREAQEFQSMLQELAYTSKHPKHPQKRREVGMLLLGQFSDDISMYSVRNSKFNLMTLVSTILCPENTSSKFKNLKSLITGRMFSGCTMIVDLVNIHDKETTLFFNRVISAAFESISAQMPTSVRMSATRCLIKCLRRLPTESLPKPEVIQKGLPNLLNLLESASLETVNLPVEAFATLSKQYEAQVTSMAHLVTPKL
jgi:hypothetical protein